MLGLSNRFSNYRIIKSRYKATLREFHVVRRQLDFLRRFCLTSMSGLDVEYQDVFNIAARLTSDCAWYRDVLHNVTTDVELYLQVDYLTVRFI